MKPFNKRLHRGESAAFVELYDQIGERLYRFAFARLRSSQDAADVVQEIFVRLVKSHRKLAKAENLNGYVFTIARNETIRWLKKNKPTPELQQHESDELSENSTNHSVETDDWINNLLGRLENVDREIVQLKVFSQLTFKEISTATQLPEPNVTSRYRRAIAKLEANLKTERSTEMSKMEENLNDA